MKTPYKRFLRLKNDAEHYGEIVNRVDIFFSDLNEEKQKEIRSLFKDAEYYTLLPIQQLNKIELIDKSKAEEIIANHKGEFVYG